MSRFAIASQGRSGSTFLQHLRDSHPGIRCDGEVVSGWGPWQTGHADLSLEEYLDRAPFGDETPGCSGSR